jgi:hypothetical protein
MLSLCPSMPIYLVLVIEGCSFLERLSRTLKTYSKRGALYIASLSYMWNFRVSGYATNRDLEVDDDFHFGVMF